jgi:hypothetical protein
VSLWLSNGREFNPISPHRYLESRFFRVRPGKIYFSRSADRPEISKHITIESNCTSNLFVEAVSSKHDIITAVRSCGVIKPGESTEVAVTPKLKAFQNRNLGHVFVTVMIDNAKIDIPVKFIE